MPADATFALADDGGETPFDDKLHEECGVYGILGVDEAANYVALGLHALQHRGQEAAGIVAYHPETDFNPVRRVGLVRDNFTKQSVMDALPGRIALGHTRYSTAGSKAGRSCGKRQTPIPHLRDAAICHTPGVESPRRKDIGPCSEPSPSTSEHWVTS